MNLTKTRKRCFKFKDISNLREKFVDIDKLIYINLSNQALATVKSITEFDTHFIFNLCENEIIEYLRDKNNNPYGVMYAGLIEPFIYDIGISTCNNKVDTFNKKTALKIAKERAFDTPIDSMVIKIRLNDRYKIYNFIKRAQRYFQDSICASNITIENNYIIKD